MRAAVITDGHSLEVVEVPDPTPGSRELVLRVSACGICGSDLKAVKFLPAGVVMGHEFCGEVVATGKDASGDWRVGDHVAALPVIGCGACAACRAGDVAHCVSVDLLGVAGSQGAFAEYVRVSARETFALPEQLRDGTGALVEPLAVGLHAVQRAALQPGDKVLVIGAGPVGVAVTLWARKLGAGEIVVSDVAEGRREAAASFGASGAIDPSTEALGGPYDVVFECVGKPGMLDTCVGAAAVHGRVVIVGVCTEPDPFIPVSAVLKEITMHFVVYYRRDEFAQVIIALGSGDLDPGPFVTDRVSLDGIAGAFRALTAPNLERKILVTP